MKIYETKIECDSCNTKELINESDSGNKVSNIIDGLCPVCRDKNEKSQVINPSEVLKQSRELDNNIKVRTDLFNAQTTSIMDLKRAIDADESITNKPYAFAEEIQTRMIHFKKVIFQKEQELETERNNLYAHQIQMNHLANQLRADEREKLKIQDINYKPQPITGKVTVKRIKHTRKKIDIRELREYAAKLGIAEFTLQLIVTQKNCSVVEAYEILKTSIESQSTKTNEVK